ncbi:MAG: SAM-dependent methyltransferase, partial [Bacillota bacterium]
MEQYNCPRVFVIGLGPGRIGDMTVSALELMNGASCVLLRTSHHPTVNDLADKGISYETLDQLYEEGDDFEAVYRAIAVKVIDAARSAFEDDRAAYVVYAVPGSPYIGERSVQLLMEISERVGVSVSILPAVSFLDSVVCSAGIDPFDGLQVVDALSIDSVPLNTSVALVVPQVYSRMVASAVKSRLLQAYPDEHPVLLAKAVRTDSELVERMNLYEIDRDDRVDYLTPLVVPP